MTWIDVDEVEEAAGSGGVAGGALQRLPDLPRLRRVSGIDSGELELNWAEVSSWHEQGGEGIDLVWRD